MAWMESHQTLRDHPKKDRLAELLFNGSVPDDVADFAAAGLLHYFWYWALDYAQDGDLSKFSDRQVSKGCRYRGDATLLVQSLIEAGFVEKDRQIHDWYEYAGRLLAKRETDRARKAHQRVRGTSTGQDADAPRDGAGTHTQTNKQTVQTDSTDKELMATSVADFEDFWTVYPRKYKKQTALRAWAARAKDKNVPAEMIAAARIYADHCRTGHTEPRYIMHAATFIGPDVPYLEWLHGIPAGAGSDDGNGKGPTVVKRPTCPECEADLTYDDRQRATCPMCDYREVTT